MSDTSIRETLAEHEFFAGLTPEHLETLANAAHLREVDADKTLFFYGEHADRFYLIRSGTVTVEIASISGPPLELQRLGPGKLLGWSWLIPPYKWHFQARTLEPSEVVEFDGEAILAESENDPKLGYELLKRFAGMMSERFNFAREKMMEEWNPPGFA